MHILVENSRTSDHPECTRVRPE